MNSDLFFHKNSVMPRLTAVACAICIVVFIGLALGGDQMTWEQSARWGHYPDDALWDGKPWTLITSAFVHFEIFHIGFNLYWLWILGNCLEDEIGPLRWLIFFLAAAWVSSAFELLIGGSQGIGMSGVGYALFGFGWIAKEKMPSFRPILNQQTVITFLLWLVGCAVMTYAGLMNIANVAHLAGLLFGVGVAGVFVVRWRLPISAPTLLLLCAGSVVPVFWCPLSVQWTGRQASAAQAQGKYDESIYWYRQCMNRSLKEGANTDWIWVNLALVYKEQNNQKEYLNAVEQLRKTNKGMANELEPASE